MRLEIDVVQVVATALKVFFTYLSCAMKTLLLPDRTFWRWHILLFRLWVRMNGWIRVLSTAGTTGLTNADTLGSFKVPY